MNNLVCTKCGKKYSLDESLWSCTCGGLLDIEFESVFPLDKIKKRKLSMWRYREAIPIQDDTNIISFSEGFTPMLPVAFHNRPVLIKQEQLFSTGSFKDRGAAVLISKMKELGITKVVEDSSGNAGCAIAAYCAKAGIDCEIYVPENTAPGKLAQIQAYGADVKKIPGSREDTAKAVQKAAKKYYYASHYWNPYFFQGTKTFAFEVCEQLGWEAPTAVVLPVGNGTLLLGSYIGFTELQSAGIIDNIPKLVGVQSKNCSPLYEPFQKNLKTISKIVGKDTIAEGIAVAEPVRGKQILEAVKKSKGDIIVVDEHEIKKSLGDIIEKGYFIEPTSAVTTAGVDKYLEKSAFEEVIVSAFTGHGLKASEKIFKILAQNE